MKYHITHKTLYQYSQPVNICHSLAYLTPGQFSGQRCLSHRLEISPEPVDFYERQDFFGNCVSYFSVQQPHIQLSVSAVSEIEVHSQMQMDFSFPESWEQVSKQIQMPFKIKDSPADSDIVVRLCRMDSKMIVASSRVHEYASASFRTGVSLLSAITDLTRRIYQDFVYDPGFTTVATPLTEVLHHKRGVCQDFAHLAIACCRAYGIAARYVSGYIETIPPEGECKLQGSDESHAWFSVFFPGIGWLDFDPTNNCRINEQYVVMALGRDYSDVTPLKGLAIGGQEHTISVSVYMDRVE